MTATKVAPNLLSWASDIEQDTIEQAARTARLPFVAGHVALMPVGAARHHPDLAYLVQGEPSFEIYIGDMLWAQAYVMGSRAVMAGRLRPRGNRLSTVIRRPWLRR